MSQCVTTLDVSRYRRVNKPYIEYLLKDKTHTERMEWLSLVAAVTGCPMIAVCQFAGELWGFTPALKERQASLMKFYQIDELTL